jgi:hypothetical protein
MQATAKTATGRVSVLGIRGGQGETLVPPTAVAGGDEGFVFEFEASDCRSPVPLGNLPRQRRGGIARGSL